MKTKFNSGDKIWIPATIRTAQNVKGKIYYGVDECDFIIPEEICEKCDEKSISTLRKAVQCAWDHHDGYSIRDNRILDV